MTHSSCSTVPYQRIGYLVLPRLFATGVVESDTDSFCHLYTSFSSRLSRPGMCVSYSSDVCSVIRDGRWQFRIV